MRDEVHGVPVARVGEGSPAGTTGPPGAGVGLGTWLRQAPPVRGLRLAAILVALNAILFGGISAALQTELGSVGGLPMSWSYFFWACVLWVGCVGLLIAPGSRTRASELALGLPVSGRHLARVHLLAVVGSGLFLLTVAIFFLGVAQWLLGRVVPPERAAFDPGLLHLAVIIAAVFLPAAVVLPGVRPTLHSVPLRGRHGLLAVAILVGGIATVLALSLLPLPLVVLPVLAAAVLARARLARAPEALSVAPLEAAVRTPRARRADHAFEAGGRPLGGLAYAWRLYSILWREAKAKIAVPYLMSFITTPMLLAFGLFLGGFVHFWMGKEPESFRFPLIAMAWYSLMAFVWPAIHKLPYVDGMAASRRAVFAVLVLPSTLTLLGSLWVGWAASPLVEQPGSLVDFRKTQDDHHDIDVPMGAREISWDGSRPRVTSPSGESHQVAAVAPLAGDAGVALYNPFSAPPGSSLEFVSHQLSRAIERVYGHTVPPAELRERYLTTDAAGRVTLQGEKLTLAQDYPELRRRRLAAYLPVASTVVIVPWLLLLTLFLRTMRASVSPSRQRATVWAIMAFCMALYLGALILVIPDIIDLDAVDGLIEVLLWRAGDLPGGTAILWIAGAVLGAVSYALAQRMFLRVEVGPEALATCTLL